MRTEDERGLWPGPRYWPRWRGVNALLAFTELLHPLIAARAPLPEGLLASVDDVPSPRLRQLLLAVQGDLAVGLALHEAMERRPAFFPRYYTDLVKAGEDSGQLAESLLELRGELLRSIELRERINENAMYVGAVLGIELVIITFLVIFVVPQFAEIFNYLKSPLPVSMRMLIEFSEALQTEVVAIPMMMMTLIAGWYFFWYSPSARKKVAGLVVRLALHVPFLRGVLVKRDLAHISAVLGRLLMAGAPLDRALESSALLDVNSRYKQSLMRVQGKILQGHSFSEALDFERGVLPVSFVGLLALGEAGGRLPETLTQVAGLYRREALRSARVLLDLTAPLPVCGIGLFVFWVYSSLWLSIVQIPQLIQAGN